MHEVLRVSAKANLFYCAFYNYLQEPANAQQTFSSSRNPTVWRTIPVLEFLQQSWENMANLPKFSQMKGAIANGLSNLQKWYRKADDTDAYFICLGRPSSCSFFFVANFLASIGS